MNQIRKKLLSAIAIMLMLTACAESVICVSTPRFSALYNESLSALVPAGLYHTIYELKPDELYAVGEKTNSGYRYGLYDIRRGLLTPLEYELLNYRDGYILFRKEGKVGLMDERGLIVIGATYSQMIPTETGYLVLYESPYDDREDEINYFEIGGGFTETGVYVIGELRPCSDGLSAFCSSSTHKYGYLDNSGRIRVDPVFDWADDFSNGISIVCRGGAYGLLKRDGTFAVDTKYARIDRTDRMICGLRRETETTSEVSAWTPVGTSIFTVIRENPVSFEIAGGYIAIHASGKTEIIDRTGQTIAELGPDAEAIGSAGDALILRDSAWGEACARVLKPDGSFSERAYQQLIPLDENCLAYADFPVIRYNSTEFDSVRLSSVYSEVLYGLADADGKPITDAVYSELIPLGHGLYCGYEGKEAKIIRRDGSSETALILP